MKIKSSIGPCIGLMYCQENGCMAVKQGPKYEPKTSHKNKLIPHKVEPAIQV